MGTTVRLILSRKGFDSTAGGVASPIFPDGSMVSFPIPERDSGLTYGELAWRGEPLAPLIEQLTRGRIPAHYGVHLDPDLQPDTRPRAPGWKPLLGQVGAAQTVLARAGVGTGDVFLFFGWFRHVEHHRGGVRYVRGDLGAHVLFGWLQIAEVLSLKADEPPLWAARHPHVAQPQRTHNTLYVAADRLTLGGETLDVPGAGVFRSYRPELRLTAPGESRRSQWELPGWILPKSGVPLLGYHDNPSRWERAGDQVLLDSVSRGQEFVLDLDGIQEALAWIGGLLVGDHGGAR